MLFLPTVSINCLPHRVPYTAVRYPSYTILSYSTLHFLTVQYSVLYLPALHCPTLAWSTPPLHYTTLQIIYIVSRDKIINAVSLE